jgi:hypothetical protein
MLPIFPWLIDLVLAVTAMFAIEFILISWRTVNFITNKVGSSSGGGSAGSGTAE